MAAQTAPQRSSAKHIELWMISLGHALTHWYPATFFLLLPIIGKELGLSYSAIGFIIFFDSLTTGLANVPTGIIADLAGERRKVMALALFSVGLPYLILSVSSSYWMVLLCVAFTGIGNNLWHPTAIPALSELYPQRKGLVLSIHGMAANLGDALAPLAIGAILALISWRQAVVLNLIPGLLVACATLYFLRSLGRASGGRARAPAASVERGLRQHLAGLRQSLRQRSLILILASSTFRSMTQKTLMTFLPVFLAYELGYDALWVGLGMFVLQAAGFIASPIAGYLSDRYGRQETMALSMAMTALVLVAMALAGRSTLFIALIAVLGFFLFALRPIIQAWLLELSPRQSAGSSIGILFGTQALGSASAPLIAGLIADSYGLAATFWFVAGTIVLGNLCVLAMPRQQPAQPVERGGSSA